MHRSLYALYVLLGWFLWGQAALAASKPHVVAFGKWTTVQIPLGSSESPAIDTKLSEMKMRPLYVDGHMKEVTLGPAHEITDRLFVVRRIFRLNDNLPQEASTPPRWRWQRGGWMLVDRATGHISAVALAEFDADFSAASWYRDYVAYCGISDDMKKTFAMVAQVGRRKPILKEYLSEAPGAGEIGCAAPGWQRLPVRVAFTPAEGKTLSFAIRGHAVDVVMGEDQAQEEGTQ